MNKKLLLVSLLAVGMLVGCGGGGSQSSSEQSSEEPISSETPSSEESSVETGSWTGEFGNAGYYLVGEMNGWNNFWKYQGFESFEFKKDETQEGIYTLVYSVTEEFLTSEGVDNDTVDAVDFKVMYWDGNKAPSQWYPDGVANNGVISEAGEYKLTFNLNSTESAEKTDGTGSYTLFTKAEKVGEANPETAFVQGEARKFDPKFGNVTYKVSVEEGLEIPENHSIYIHTWGLYGEADPETDIGGYYELTKGETNVWSYTTETKVMTDDGTGVGMDLGFCIIVDETGKTQQDWSKKVSSSQSTDGNYGIHVSENKLSGTAQLLIEDKPYWTKGDVTNPYTVAELKTLMDSTDYSATEKYCVTGEVVSVKYNDQYSDYNVYLKVPTEINAATKEELPATWEFMVYGGKLKENIAVPEVGDTIIAEGYSKIYTPSEGLPVYELAYKYVDDVKVVPEILKVTKSDLFYLYVRGDLTSWGIVPSYKLSETNTPNVYQVTVSLEAGNQFKLSNATDNWDVQYGGATAKAQLVADSAVASCFDLTGDNVVVVTAGSYTFTYDCTGETPVASVKAAA